MRRTVAGVVATIAFMLVGGVIAPSSQATPAPWRLVLDYGDGLHKDPLGHPVRYLQILIAAQLAPTSTAAYTLSASDGATWRGVATFPGVADGGLLAVSLPCDGEVCYPYVSGSYKIAIEVNIPAYLGAPASWYHREYAFNYQLADLTADPIIYTRAATATATRSVKVTAKKSAKVTVKRHGVRATRKATAKASATKKATKKAMATAVGYSASEASATASTAAAAKAETSASAAAKKSATKAAMKKALAKAKKLAKKKALKAAKQDLARR